MRLSVRRRLVALVVLAGMIALAGALLMRARDLRLHDDLRRADLNRTQSLIRTVLRLHSSQINAMVFETTYWDELVTFTEARDLAWADAALQGALSSWGLDGVWVFDRHGNELYASDAAGRDIPCPLSTVDLARVAKPQAAPGHAHVRDGSAIWSVYAGTIHGSSDAARKGPWHGYLVYASRVGPEYWSELESDAQCRIMLAQPSDPVAVPTELVTSVHLRDPEGKPLLRADFLIGSTVSDALHASGFGATVWATLLGLAICLTVGAGLYLWVYRPLGVLSTALREDRPEALAAMRGVVDEFGRVAQLLEQSFAQRESLRKEISERQTAEAARAQRDSIVSAVAFAAEEMLRPGPWADRLGPSVARLGESVGASRMHVLQVFDDADATAYACVCDWTADDCNLPPCVPNEKLTFLDQGLGAWPARLRSGQIVHGPVRDLEPQAAEAIGRSGSLSIVSTPIFAGEVWWGFIGIDECRQERSWSAAELDGLNMAARLIGAAVCRELADAQIAHMAQLERAIIDASPIGISVRDPRGRLLRHNEAWQRIWAMTDEDVAEDLARVRTELQLDLRDSYLGASALAVERVYREGGAVHVEELPTTGSRPGAAKWVSQRFYAIQDADGAVDRVVILTEDISKRKEAEDESRRLVEELKRAAIELDERVRRRTADLLALNAELEAFAYSVSHDLKAPLRAVDGFSQALLEDYSSELPPEGVRYASLVRQAAREMATLINRILELSRLSRARLKTEKSRLSDIALAALVPFEEEIATRGVRVDIEETPECQVDPGLMQHVLSNLLSNALKYTRPVEHPHIRFSEQDGVYCVRDNGVGFAADSAENLFAPFQRFHSASEFEGSGVGLAIVKRIVSRHGGVVWAKSVPSEGAAFYFTIDETVRPPEAVPSA